MGGSSCKGHNPYDLTFWKVVTKEDSGLYKVGYRSNQEMREDLNHASYACRTCTTRSRGRTASRRASRSRMAPSTTRWETTATSRAAKRRRTHTAGDNFAPPARLTSGSVPSNDICI